MQTVRNTSQKPADARWVQLPEAEPSRAEHLKVVPAGKPAARTIPNSDDVWTWRSLPRPSIGRPAKGRRLLHSPRSFKGGSHEPPLCLETSCIPGRGRQEVRSFARRCLERTRHLKRQIKPPREAGFARLRHQQAWAEPAEREGGSFEPPSAKALGIFSWPARLPQAEPAFGRSLTSCRPFRPCRPCRGEHGCGRIVLLWRVRNGGLGGDQRAAIEAASCSAVRTTLAGSMMPFSIMSPYCVVLRVIAVRQAAPPRAPCRPDRALDAGVLGDLADAEPAAPS